MRTCTRLMTSRASPPSRIQARQGGLPFPVAPAKAGAHAAAALRQPTGRAPASVRLGSDSAWAPAGAGATSVSDRPFLNDGPSFPVAPAKAGAHAAAPLRQRNPANTRRRSLGLGLGMGPS